MTSMTWLELKNYIDNTPDLDLDQPVKIYDMNTGDSLECDIIQLNENDEWLTFIAVNLEDT